MPNQNDGEEIELSISPMIHNGKVILQLKKIIIDQQKMLHIVQRAFKEEYIPAKIIFRDKLRAYVKLRELGLIKENGPVVRGPKD